MKQLIERLDSWLKANRPGYYAELQPGVSAAELAEQEQFMGLVLPQSLKDLYMWRNGQTIKSYKGLQYNYVWMNIRQARQGWTNFKGLLDAGEFKKNNWWRREWFPFLDNGAGDHICVDMAGAFTGTKGQVLEFWHNSPERCVVYPSLECWLEIFVDSLEQGLWADDGGDMHPVDEEKWKAFAAKHNSGYPISVKAG